MGFSTNILKNEFNLSCHHMRSTEESSPPATADEYHPTIFWETDHENESQYSESVQSIYSYKDFVDPPRVRLAKFFSKLAETMKIYFFPLDKDGSHLGRMTIQGKYVPYGPIYSLYIFSNRSPIRIAAAELCENMMFRNFIFVCVVCNSLLYAVADYRYVDSKGNLDPNASSRNSAMASIDFLFVSINTAECIIKIIAMGFVTILNEKDKYLLEHVPGSRGAYLSDHWNWLDFAVAVSGMCSINLRSLTSTSPTMLRTFRIFRALCSFRTLKGLRSIVQSVLIAMPKLTQVLVLFFFVLFLFSVVGIILFQGPGMHMRCRKTPFPVNTSWVEGLPFDDYRCLNVSTFTLLSDEPKWTKESSPWRCDYLFPITHTVLAQY